MRREMTAPADGGVAGGFDHFNRFGGEIDEGLSGTDTFLSTNGQGR